MTLVASAPRPYAAAASRPVLGDRRRVQSRFPRHRPREPWGDVCRPVARGGRGEIGRRSGAHRGRPLPLVRQAPTGLRGAVRAGRLRVVTGGVEQPGNGRRSGIHDRTRRSCPRAGRRRPCGYGVPTRSRVVEIGTPDRRRGVRRHASRPRSTFGAGFRACGSRVPSVPVKPSAGRRRPAVLRRSEQPGPLASRGMDDGFCRSGWAAVVAVERPDLAPDGSGPGRRLGVCLPGSRGRRSASHPASSSPARSRPGSRSPRPLRSAPLV